MVNAFCGELQNATSITRDGVLSSECFLDGLSFMPHILFVLVSLPVLITWNKSEYGSMHVKSWVHFPGHNVRWILTVLLFVLNLMEIGEGLISNSLYEGTHLHLFLPQCIGVIGTVVSVLYYHYVELWNSARFLMFLWCYWGFLLITKVLKMVHLLKANVGPAYMRFNFTCVAILLYACFLCIEAYVLYKLRFAIFPRPRKLRPPEELEHTTYVQDYVSCLSRITFFWVTKLLVTGYNHPLEMKDLGKLPPSEWVVRNYHKLYKSFEDEKVRAGQKKRKVSLWRAYWLAFWLPLVVAGLFKLCGDLLGFIGPLCISFLIDFVSKSWSAPEETPQSLPQEQQYVKVQPFFSHGYMLCLTLLVATVLQNTALQMHHFLVIRQGIRIRAALQVLVYRKTLRLAANVLPSSGMSLGLAANLISVDVYNVMMAFYMGHYVWALPLMGLIYSKALRRSVAAGAGSMGQMANHISVDASNVMMFVYTFCYIWAMPLQVTITLYLLYHQLGYSALIAGSLLLALCPIQYFLAKVYSKIQKKTLACSDERLRLVSELLAAIKLVKLCAWEKFMGGRVRESRSKQLKLLLKGSCLVGLTGFITHGAPLLVTLVAFVLYPSLQGEPLTAGKAFTSLALFDILSIPLHLFPLMINILVNAVISTQRILKFLLSPEVEDFGPLAPEAEDKERDMRVEFFLSREESIAGIPGLMSSQCQHSSFSLPVGGEKHWQKLSSLPTDGTTRLHASHSLPQTAKLPGSGLLHHDGHGRPHTVPSLMADNGSQNGRKRQRSTASMSECDDHRNNEMLNVEQRLRPRSMGNLRGSTERELYDVAEDGTVGPAVAVRRPRTLSGGAIMLRHNLQSRQSLGSISDYVHHEEGSVLEIVDAGFTWDSKTDRVELKGLNLNIEAGVLTVIVGMAGAGKSSLLAATLGEMTRLTGTVAWKPWCRIAFAAQIPWLLNDSLQNNILFGATMEKKRYRRVLHACALNPDISILPAGDQTEIGEKGINLSGGQKQRISIARALYSHANVIILDDPFSALDSHVGAHIFESGIMKMLLKRRCTVVMVTHHLQYMACAHEIVTVTNGEVKQHGNLDNVMATQPDLYDSYQRAVNASMLEEGEKREDDEWEAEIDVERWCLQHHMSTREFQRQPSQSQQDLTSQNMPIPDSDLVATSPRQVFYGRQISNFSTHDDTNDSIATVAERHLSHASLVQASGLETPQLEEDPQTELSDKAEEDGHLIEAEERQQGSVSCAVYSAYIKACSVTLSVIVVLLHLTKSGTHMATDFWLADWASAAESTSNNGTNKTELRDGDLDYFIRGYMGFALVTVVLSLLVAFGCELIGLRASALLHTKMLNTVIHAPLRFFDMNPIGRIINRFSADTFIIDDKLPTSIGGLLRTTLLCVSALLVNVIATPYFLLPAVPIILIYFFLQKFYRASSRELARLDSLSKSPIMSHFMETLNGLATIRAYRDERRFQQIMLDHIDHNMTVFLWLNTANRWLGVRLDHLGALVVFTAAVSTVTASVLGHITPGLVGLGISYALMMSSYLNWVVRMMTDTEMQMNAVERVVYYGNLPIEEMDPHSKKDGVLDSWPSAGEIKYCNVSLRYDATLEPAVKHINLHIKAGQKVGICGRTGSGKSSMTLGLFRIIEICQGHILIDGHDISKVSLETLRSRLSIIPQDPVLFSGSIRYNLDPEAGKCDEDLWQALEIAQLKKTIEGLEGKLDAEVSEGGANFSVGQRQLFCLARAFLRDSRILVMDEATASIDMETDALIQDVIKSAFENRTVLTIAHRLSTIVSYDIIIVLDQGRVVEWDTPQNLLANQDSAYCTLVRGTK